MPFNRSARQSGILRHGVARRVFGSLLALALALFVAWMFRDRISLTAGLSNASNEGPGAGYPTQIYYGPANSIAVLPFENTNSGGASHDESFLATGFSESLIDQLVQNPKLQVTAASSAFYFKGRQGDLPIVAERLRVSHLLEGVIRESDDNLHITVRLVRVNPDKELWSESFDRSYRDLPQLRNEIAAGVAAAMHLEHDSGGKVRNLNTEAWLLLLEGRYLLQRREAESLQRAEAVFNQALKIDPAFGDAWLGLAELYLDPSWSGAGDEPGHERARKAARTALELNPALAGAHVVLSQIKRAFDWEWQSAREMAQMALKLRPGSAEVLRNASNNEFTFGNFERAAELFEGAIRRDPVILPHLLGLGLLYEFSGDYDESLIVYRQLLALNPDYPAVHAYRARVKIAQDKPESALREADQETDAFWKRYARILALIALERFDEAEPLLDQMIQENAYEAAFQIAEIHAFRGDPDSAFEWLERAYEQRDGGMSEIVGNQLLAGLEEDERWSSLLSRMGLQ
jgi:TolB-like protein/Tfp pilus assembly protein PilF